MKDTIQIWLLLRPFSTLNETSFFNSILEPASYLFKVSANNRLPHKALRWGYNFPQLKNMDLMLLPQQYLLNCNQY